MTKRTLSLRRESLTELTGADLARVAAAAAALSGPSCPLDWCLDRVSDAVSCHTSCAAFSGCC